MPFLPLLALALGFALCYIPASGLHPDEGLARYTAIAIIAGLDTILGGIRAWSSDDFDDVVFVSGFFANAVLAMGLVWLGEKLGLETGFGDMRISVMMVAAVVVFGSRILNNLAAIRRLLIQQWRERRKTAGYNVAVVRASAANSD